MRLSMHDLCDHFDDYALRISSHKDLTAANERNEGHASAYCCERAECIATVERWVREETGREPVDLPMRLRRDGTLSL